MKRGAALKRSKGLRQRSKKREHLYAREGGRRDVVAHVLASRPWCEACDAIAVHLHDARSTVRPPACPGPSQDVHEINRRSAGGSILDESNLIATCRPGHRWIHEHPREAIALGLLASRYPGRNAGPADGEGEG